MHTPYQVLVVSADHGNAMVHCGPPAKQQLLLLAHDAHYDVITELNGYFGVILVYNAGKPTRPRKEVPPYPRNKKELPSVKKKLGKNNAKDIEYRKLVSENTQACWLLYLTDKA